MLLDIKNLRTYFYTRRGVVKAVENVDLSVDKGEFVSIVGESGCGKSTLAYSVIRMISYPGEIVGGEIIFDGRDVLKLNEEELRALRGKEIGMVFQDPMTSLDPLEKIGDQITETILEHMDVSKKEALQIAGEMLEKVGLPADRVNYYPHQLSGGQRQRVMIAMAVSLNPKLLIADEPTTALDVIVQEKIMDLLDDMRKEGRAIMLITHDFALASERSDKIAVMYAGWLVELGSAKEIAHEPLHPYSKGLIDSVPDVWIDKEVKPLPGFPPDLINPPEGCRFRPRCPFAKQECVKEPPALNVDGRVVKCWLYEV
ncbi:oligopeptide/dipeptide ABC transporter, ATP-binding protein, C-terminal domain protein [Archaeoglobus sulfaticallidus PM70-1]|uniref:Oligopeptide/dipeptide ABC transporter, ATP-binding protein, C-terminal domain protein n=1 Tax=Archaeoglobus sulfaticallidus PM70-1 TaxID=387631 RepID=N0BD79_9EURY|nr:ABC transporter ATP-binding protein [Archaeoglobus sulfaticallidus]AGK61564.1 oligopeptide/dipeptide ABC transporter, ATP-binding protein, C-terminal domain protein [Archaeoglobus sulfaticallidus PM70-1]